MRNNFLSKLTTENSFVTQHSVNQKTLIDISISPVKCQLTKQKEAPPAQSYCQCPGGKIFFKKNNSCGWSGEWETWHGLLPFGWLSMLKVVIKITHNSGACQAIILGMHLVTRHLDSCVKPPTKTAAPTGSGHTRELPNTQQCFVTWTEPDGQQASALSKLQVPNTVATHSVLLFC